MTTDAQLLENCPDFISIGSMLKATPATEGSQRIIYFEASNEGLDQQGEVVAAKALSDSSDFFLKYGNVDLDHYTLIGAKAGIPDYSMYEIGRPCEVKQVKGVTFVKAEIYSGIGQAAERANQFWSSLTEINPPANWYPSVGGSVLEKSIEIDPDSKERLAIIKKVRWNNVGLSKQPVNQHVATCATVPVGAFAKSFSAAMGGYILKNIEAGYGTDSASLASGGAMRKQSLYGSPINYFDARNKASQALTNKSIKVPSISEITKYANENFGMSLDESAEFCERFMRDIHKNLKRSNPNVRYN